MFNAEKVPDIEGYTHSFEPKCSSSCHLLHNKIFGKKKIARVLKFALENSIGVGQLLAQYCAKRVSVIILKSFKGDMNAEEDRIPRKRSHLFLLTIWSLLELDF